MAMENLATTDLPAIPAKRYFTIGEVSELCGVKPHVLRYWEQEFTQLKPLKRRGNRRYYRLDEVLVFAHHGFVLHEPRRARGDLASPRLALRRIRVRELERAAHVVVRRGRDPSRNTHLGIECESEAGPHPFPGQRDDGRRH